MKAEASRDAVGDARRRRQVDSLAELGGVVARVRGRARRIGEARAERVDRMRRVQ
jgi:hypothetical protein